MRVGPGSGAESTRGWSLKLGVLCSHNLISRGGGFRTESAIPIFECCRVSPTFGPKSEASTYGTKYHSNMGLILGSCKVVSAKTADFFLKCNTDRNVTITKAPWQLPAGINLDGFLTFPGMFCLHQESQWILCALNPCWQTGSCLSAGECVPRACSRVRAQIVDLSPNFDPHCRNNSLDTTAWGHDCPATL